jgi:hypothetical protein
VLCVCNDPSIGGYPLSARGQLRGDLVQAYSDSRMIVSYWYQAICPMPVAVGDLHDATVSQRCASGSCEETSVNPAVYQQRLLWSMYHGCVLPDTPGQMAK